MSDYEITPEMFDDGQHVFNHSDYSEPKVNVKVEKNSKGYNWEVTVVGCENVDQALMMINEAETKLWQMFGDGPAELPKKEVPPNSNQ